MLRLSKLTDYGIVVMTYLAREPQRVLAAGEVSSGVWLAPPTVSKLLKLLCRANLVLSVRGSRGGYRLARNPDEISVGEVVDALEGPVALTECSSETGNCVQEPHCSIRVNFQRINVAIRAALEGVTLADLAQSTDSRIPDTAGLHVPSRAEAM